jgi:hypothetical protein
MAASYIAIDTSLSTYVLTKTGGNYFAIVAQVGQTHPANFTTGGNYNYMGFSGYTGSTKFIIFCPYIQFNPGLTTNDRSMGVYLKVNTVTTTSFIVSAKVPFGLDNFTRYDCRVIYFNPD